MPRANERSRDLLGLPVVVLGAVEDVVVLEGRLIARASDRIERREALDRRDAEEPAGLGATQAMNVLKGWQMSFITPARACSSSIERLMMRVSMFNS